MGKRKTHEEFIKEMEVKNPNIKVLGEYTGCKNKIKVMCSIHNCIWEPTVEYLLKGAKCPKCTYKGNCDEIVRNHDDFVKKVKKYHPNLEVVSNYINTKTKVTIRCKIDMYEWNIRPDNLFQGLGCRICRKKIKVEKPKKIKVEKPKKIKVEKPKKIKVEKPKKIKVEKPKKIKVEKPKKEPIVDNNNKICSICKKKLPLTKDYFGVQKSTKSGFRSACKECTHKRAKDKYRNNPEINKIKYKKSKEYFKEYYKEYYKKNKQEYNRRANERRIKKFGNGGKYTKLQLEECLEWFDYRCAYTGEKLDDDNINIDHIIPVSKGGVNAIWNLCPSINYANKSKHAQKMENWYKKQLFYDERKLKKIYEWVEYAKDKYSV